MTFTSIHLTLKEAAELIGVSFYNVNDDLTSLVSNNDDGLHYMSIDAIKAEYGNIFTHGEFTLVPELIQRAIAFAQAKAFRIHDVDGKIRYLRNRYTSLVPRFKRRFSVEHEGESHEFCDYGGIAQFQLTSNKTVKITFQNPDVFFNYLIYRLNAKGYFMTKEMSEDSEVVLQYAKLFLEFSFIVFSITLPLMIPLEDRRNVGGAAIVEFKRLIKYLPFGNIIDIVEKHALRTRDLYLAVNTASQVFGYTERRIMMGIEEKATRPISHY
jgi:hypothetical protein